MSCSNKDRKHVLIVVTLMIMSIFSLPLVFGATGFTNDQDMFFTGSSSDPSTVYQDAIGSNSDVGMELCGQGQRYVGGFYAISISSVFTSTLVTYGSATEALSFTDQDQGGGCFATLPGFLTVSPSELTTPDPDVRKAAFPGKLFIGHGASQNPGTVSSFEFANTNAQLLGSFSATQAFSQSTRQVTVQAPTITFQTSSSSFSKSVSDSDFGVDTDQRIVVGHCTDSNGETCTAGSLISSSGSFPLALDTGLTAGQVDDQNTYTRYTVFNGLGQQMCIGANLQATIGTVSPNPIYYSQTLTINFSTNNPTNTPFETNGGNVQVDTDFTVRLRIYNTSNSNDIKYEENFTITDSILPGQTVSRGTTWPALEHSGSYTVQVVTDVDDNINECVEGDNTATSTFTLLPITLPTVKIDGTENNNFSVPGVPYNLSVELLNSDNDTLSNASLELIEINGMNVAAPTQLFNRSIDTNVTTKDGIRSKNIINTTSDKDGFVNITFIPTYNTFYTSPYSYLNLSGHIGIYELFFTGRQSDSQEFVFIVNEQVETQYNFSILNPTYSGAYSHKVIENEEIASQAMDFIYHIYTHFIDTIIQNGD